MGQTRTKYHTGFKKNNNANKKSVAYICIQISLPLHKIQSDGDDLLRVSASCKVLYFCKKYFILLSNASNVAFLLSFFVLATDSPPELWVSAALAEVALRLVCQLRWTAIYWLVCSCQTFCFVFNRLNFAL